MRLFIPHANPFAKSTYTTLKVYKNFNLKNAYDGHNYFWSFSPVKGDLIGFKFDSPVYLERQVVLLLFYTFNHVCLIFRCLIRSGNPEHPGDIIQNATLQIKPFKDQVLVSDPKHVSSVRSDNFVNLGPFVDGFANVLIPSQLNPVEEVRIKFDQNCTHWIIISEVSCV